MLHEEILIHAGRGGVTEKIRCLPQKHDKYSPTSKTQNCKDLVCSAILALSSSTEKKCARLRLFLKMLTFWRHWALASQPPDRQSGKAAAQAFKNIKCAIFH